MDVENNKIIHTPIPTAIPSPPPLDSLPFDVLHSATVEMLIQQNDDLTSRLKINIRRNSQLEQKILELEQKVKETSHHRENLELQLDVVLEKEKKWDREKEAKDNEILNLEKKWSEEKEAKENEILNLKEVKENEILNLKEKIEKIILQQNKLNIYNQENSFDLKSRIVKKDGEIRSLRGKIARLHRIRTLIKERLSRLKTETSTIKSMHIELCEKTEKENLALQTGINDAKEEIHLLQKKIKVFQRLKNRGKDRLREFLLQTAQNFLHHKDQLDQSQSLNRQMTSNIESLKSDILKKEVEFKEHLHSFKRKSEERYHKVSNHNEKLFTQNKKLHEIQEELQNEVSRLSSDFHEEKKNRIKVKHLCREINDLKNEKIWLKRNLEENLEKAEQNKQIEMEKSRQLKKEVEEVQFIGEQQKEKLKSCEIKLLEMNKDNQELSDQLNSIQSLWIAAQEKLEKTELKNQSLEKINRELSHQFKDQRINRITQRVLRKEEVCKSEISKKIPQVDP